MKIKVVYPYVYAICRVDKDNFLGINKDLKKYGYKNIRAIVPKVELLKHIKNGSKVYEYRPLLFNYGFVKMFNDVAHDRIYLDNIRKDIPGIHSWVRSLDNLHEKRIMRRTDSRLDFDDFSKVETVSKSEVLRLQKVCKQKYTHSNLADVAIGDMVTLNTYPYVGMDALILGINMASNTARIELFPGNVSVMIIDVALDIVLYSVYRDYDDKVITQEQDFSLDIIPDDSSEELL